MKSAFASSWMSCDRAVHHTTLNDCRDGQRRLTSALALSILGVCSGRWKRASSRPHSHCFPCSKLEVRMRRVTSLSEEVEGMDSRSSMTQSNRYDASRILVMSVARVKCRRRGSLSSLRVSGTGTNNKVRIETHGPYKLTYVHPLFQRKP